MNDKLKLALILFFLGFSGVLSTFTMEFPLPQEAGEVLSSPSATGQIKLFLFIIITILLLLSVILGTLYHDKVKLKLPILERLLKGKKLPNLYPLLIISLGGGLFSGLLITLTILVFQSFLPLEYLQMGNYFYLNTMSRILFGGITEEIIARFGLMTGIIWLLYNFSKSLKPGIYWVSIAIAAIIFSILQLSLGLTANEELPLAVFIYILLTSVVGGIVFGWLYWKKGLEVAILGHIITHFVLLLGQIN